MSKLFCNKKKCFLQPIESALIALMMIFGSYIISPNAASALSLDLINPVAPVVFYEQTWQLPISEDNEPRRVFYSIPITAYSSEVGQTDSTPFITASGTTVRRGVVAANFLPIGTKIRIPELYGNEVFVVEDRMNARYNQRVDIWMEETADARNFGVNWTTIEVF